MIRSKQNALLVTDTETDRETNVCKGQSLCQGEKFFNLVRHFGCCLTVLFAQITKIVSKSYKRNVSRPRGRERRWCARGSSLSLLINQLLICCWVSSWSYQACLKSAIVCSQVKCSDHAISHSHTHMHTHVRTAREREGTFKLNFRVCVYERYVQYLSFII